VRFHEIASRIGMRSNLEEIDMPINDLDDYFKNNIPRVFNPSDRTSPNVQGVKLDPMTGKVISLNFAKPEVQSGETAPVTQGINTSQMNRDVHGVPQVMEPPETGILATLKKAFSGIGGVLGGAFSSADEALKDPEKGAGIARMLATLGQAFSAAEPNSWQNQLSRTMVQTAAGQQAQAMREGKELPGVAGFGITPDEMSAMVKEELAKDRMGLAEREVAAREEQVEKIPTIEEETASRIAIEQAKPVTAKGYQLQTYPNETGGKTTVLLDPNSGTRYPIATSPRQSTSEDVSLSAEQRRQYQLATKLTATQLARQGYGQIVQLDDQSWTIKYTKEIADSPEKMTEAEAEYRRILRGRLTNLINTNKLPKDYLEVEFGAGGEEEEFSLYPL